MASKNCKIEIIEVAKNSVAQKHNIQKGDRLIAFDGHLFVDTLDYIFYNSKDSFLLSIEDKKGKIRDIVIEKHEDEDLGIVLEDINLEIIPCTNKCIFCFVDQCKKGMRDTLYVKDDDYRLSFISGNYITLTNLNQEDIDRIIRLKLSPLYISVHCKDADLRKKLCANLHSRELFDKIDRLIEGGITLHTQIVLMEGLNDQKELQRTMTALFDRYPHIQSLAVVPVGITKHRKGLYPLMPISYECAKRTIKEVEAFNHQAIKSTGKGFVWCSDEMYLIAEKRLPSYDYYEDFPQIENGVGLVSEFLYSLTQELEDTPDLHGCYTLITGKSFGSILKNIATSLEEVYGIKLDVKVIVNKFFGESITVAGLITGRDILDQLKGNIVYKDIIIPHTMLKEFDSVFLDDVTLSDIEKELECKVFVARGGEGLVKVLKGE